MKSAVFTCSLVVILLSLFTSILLVTPANAQEASLRIKFTVNTTADTHDANWGNGVCADQQGRCSLRAAIEEADALPYGSTVTIVVPTGTYRLLKGTLRLSAHRSIMIHGASSKTTTIEGNKTFRIMSIGSPSLFVQLSHLTIEGGEAVVGNSQGGGGGIFNEGTLAVSNSTISSNSADTSGGGIFNDGTLTVSNSTIRDNTTPNYFDGGGIFNEGKMTVSNSTVNGNSDLHGRGGGIFNDGTLTVSNSTISDNLAISYGGGMFNDGTLMLSNSTISGNSAPGGGIENDGTLTISNSTISGNSSGNSSSGGIFNIGKLTVSNSTISDNSAGAEGGGIENYATLTLSNSTISGNSAQVGGGLDNTGTLTVSNSTISGNSTIGRGNCGGLDNWGTLTVSNSTISGNSALYDGGICNSAGALTVSNSTISGNSAGGGGSINNSSGTFTLTSTIVANSTGTPNCYGTITDMGYNLDSDGSCGFTLSSDLNKVDPMLGPLQNNGGPTQTMALLQGSKAIDWVALTNCPATDQRGDVRPDNNESVCDIGAYESAY